MTPDAARRALHEEIARIAPDADAASVPGDADFREELDLDSMDFLNLVAALHKRFGVEIPESDYPELATLDGFAGYLAGRAAA